MNELSVMTAGGNALPADKKTALTALQQRLGVKAVPSPQQSAIKLIALLFDATGSMDPIWQEAKEKMRKLVARQRELMPQAKLVLIAYRDYCDGNRILEVSKQSMDLGELSEFLDRIECDGGGDNPEAVEAALEKALQLKPDLSILVGDAPPHGVEDQIVDGNDYRELARELGGKDIPVYTVAVRQDRSTASSFKEIAELSKGQAFQLNQIDELIDLLSAVSAKRAGQLSDLAAILKRENGGALTSSQERLLLQAARA